MKWNDYHLAEWPVEEMKLRIIQLMEQIAHKSMHKTIDPTMSIVYEVARSLGSIPPLSQSLQNVTVRAKLADHLDSSVIANIPLWEFTNAGQVIVYLDNLPIFLHNTVAESYSYITDVGE